MSESKQKAFIAYYDWQETFEELSVEEAGKLIKHVFKYTNGSEEEIKDKAVKMAFIPIRQTIDRDTAKWEKYQQKQSDNGKKGGRPPKPKKPNAFSENPTKPKKATSINVTTNTNTTISDDEILKPFNKFIDEVKKKVHKQAIEQWYKEFEIKDGSLTTLLTQHFKGQLLTDEKVHESPTELKKHFKNWLNTMNRNGLLNEYKKKPVGSL